MSSFLRAGSLLLGVVLAAAAVAASIHAFASRSDQAAYPAPGRMIQVGEHRLHIDCRGTGSPVVVLESGAGCSSIRWRRVHERLAARTTVCAYDRAGLGWSEAGPMPRHLNQLVSEAETLLERSGQVGPFVWVGHSLGGLNARLFQARNPERVAGLVLVDATHEEQWHQFPDAVDEMLQANLQLLGAMSSAAPFGAARALRPFTPRLALPEADQGAYAAATSQKRFFDAQRSEFFEALAAADVDISLEPGVLGDLPLAVVTAKRSFHAFAALAPEDFPFEASDAVWMRLQREFLGLSSKSRHFISSEGTHELTLDDPSLVVEAVEHVLDQIDAS